MTASNNLERLAAILRNVTIVAMVALPVFILVGLISTPLTPEALNAKLNGMTVSPAATPAQMGTALALGLIGPVVLLFTLNAMRQLFAQYAQGNVLTDDCARLIQRIGQGFLTLALLQFVLQPIQSVLLSLANEPGQRALSVALTSEMFFFALAGGLIVVVGWAMREASSVAAENRAFV